MWLAFAFAGPVLWAVSTHIDKFLVDRYFSHGNTTILLVFTALIGVLFLPLIWILSPGVAAVSVRDAAVIAASGLLYMGGMFFYLRALQGEEASVVAPLFQASPLFAYGLSYVILHERLTPIQMTGGALIVAGATALTLRTSGNKARFKGRLVALMLTCAFALALSSVIFKMFAVRDEFWSTTFWMLVGEAIFGVVILVPSSHRRDLAQMFRKHASAVAAINGSNELINLGGGLANRYALLLAPLSLVQAISSTTTLFVFIFGVLLSLVRPDLGKEEVSPRNLVRKGIATTLVAAGVALVTG